MSWTPNDIDVLLHYHCSSSPHPRSNTPAVQQSLRMWIGEGVLSNGKCMATEKGVKLVEMLCNTPLPVWADPRHTEWT